ncbi:hypothetical protein, partial [Vogesella fluminis]
CVLDDPNYLIRLVKSDRLLGSVLTFIVIGMAADGANHAYMTTSRDLVLLCTRQLTLPSLLLLMLSGLAMAWHNKPYKRHWFWAKVLLAGTMLANTLWLIEPAITDSLRALSTHNTTAFDDAITRESIYGSINLLLCAALVLLGLAKRKQLVSPTG